MNINVIYLCLVQFLVQNRFGPGTKIIFLNWDLLSTIPKNPKMILDLMKDWGIRRVLLVCHKNKWHDLSQNLSLPCFCLLKGDKKTFSLVQKIFSTNKNVFFFHLKINKSSHLFLWQTDRTRLRLFLGLFQFLHW